MHAFKSRVWMMIVVAVCVSAAMSCAPSLEQFYQDDYDTRDRLYQSETLGFSLLFSAGWTIATDPRRMNKIRRAAAKQLHEQGAELIFAGQTVDGSQGVRGIVENLNRDNERFLADLRRTNAHNVDTDLGATTFMAGEVLAIKWEYAFRGMRFAEFLFKAGTCNVRIAFWTTSERYADFLPLYEDIMATLALRMRV